MNLGIIQSQKLARKGRIAQAHICRGPVHSLTNVRLYPTPTGVTLRTHLLLHTQLVGLHSVLLFCIFCHWLTSHSSALIYVTGGKDFVTEMDTLLTPISWLRTREILLQARMDFVSATQKTKEKVVKSANKVLYCM